MKELTLEQKAQRYDEAIERARLVLQERGNEPDGASILSELFPELKESEGERTRKEITTYLKSVIANKGYRDEIIESWIAWLEKQDKQKPMPIFKVGDTIIAKDGTYIEKELFHIDKIEDDCYWDGESTILVCNQDKFELAEQKPADKVEPKFHEGEWIVHHGTENIYQVIAVIDNQYQLKYGDTYTVQKCADVDRCARLWDITKDAKDGDVIYSRHNTESFEWIGIFKSLDKENKRVFFYGFWHDMAKTFSVCGKEAYVLYDDFSPATKEQRDALMKAMANAGYTFDFEKKELKKIEQKLADKEESLSDMEKYILNFADYFYSNRCKPESKWIDEIKMLRDYIPSHILKSAWNEEVDLDKEINAHWDEWAKENGFHFIDFAKHFFELGLKARKDE